MCEYGRFSSSSIQMLRNDRKLVRPTNVSFSHILIDLRVDCRLETVYVLAINMSEARSEQRNGRSSSLVRRFLSEMNKCTNLFRFACVEKPFTTDLVVQTGDNRCSNKKHENFTLRLLPPHFAVILVYQEMMIQLLPMASCCLLQISASGFSATIQQLTIHAIIPLAFSSLALRSNCLGHCRFPSHFERVSSKPPHPILLLTSGTLETPFRQCHQDHHGFILCKPQNCMQQEKPMKMEW